MSAYVIRRLIAGLVMLVVMSLITFSMFLSGPVDPARHSCGKNCPPAVIEQTRKALGYDKPTLVQWGMFMKGVVAGREYPQDEELRRLHPEQIVKCSAPCLGYSQKNLATVNSLLGSRIPVSASLAFVAFVIWITFGLGLGMIAAVKKGTLLDRTLVGSALFFYAFPTFFVGLFLLTYFAIKWQLVTYPAYVPLTEGGPIAWLKGLFLPSLTLALFYLAGYVRMTRAFVLEAMGEDYLRTAKAKGLGTRPILFKHTMRSALTPILTIAGIDLASLLGGAIITEKVFNFDGLGKLAVDSVNNLDLPTTVGIVLLLASFVILANILVDVLYAVIDPRVKLA